MRLRRVASEHDASLFVKLEQFNPSGTVEDRVADALLSQALRSGRIRSGQLLVEGATPNQAISLALACAVHGISLQVVVPDDLTREIRMLLRSHGARVDTTPAGEGIVATRRRADEIRRGTPNAVTLGVGAEDLGARAHADGTAAELIAAAKAEGLEMDAFVAEAEPQATQLAIATALRAHWPNLSVVAVHCGDASPPRDLGVTTVSPRRAWSARMRVAREEGILAGLTSGAVLAAAMDTARSLGPGKTVWALVGESGERHFSLSGKFE